MLFSAQLRAVLATIALWSITFTCGLFSIPDQPKPRITDGPRHTVSISNIASERLHEKVYQLAEQEGYSYVLQEDGDPSIASIYDPAGRYRLPDSLRQHLDGTQPLVKEGRALGQQLEAIIGQEPITFQATGYQGEAYPDVVLPAQQATQPIYYDIYISSDQPLDGEQLAHSLSPNTLYQGTVEELSARQIRWFQTSIYLGSIGIALFVYLFILYRNIQGQKIHTQTVDRLGGSRTDKLARLLRVTALPSLITLAVCALLTYLYQFTPLSGVLSGHPDYLYSLTATSILLPLVCLGGSLLLSYIHMRRVRE